MKELSQRRRRKNIIRMPEMKGWRMNGVDRSYGYIGKMGKGRNRNGQKVFLPIIAGTVWTGIIGMRKFLRRRAAKQPDHGLF